MQYMLNICYKSAWLQFLSKITTLTPAQINPIFQLSLYALYMTSPSLSMTNKHVLIPLKPAYAEHVHYSSLRTNKHIQVLSESAYALHMAALMQI